MNFTLNKSTLLILSFCTLIIFAFYACSSDDEINPKTVEDYKTELSQIISSEKNVVKNCKLGYDKGNFRNELLFAETTYNYMLALNNAELVLAKPDLTIANILGANKSITGPGKAFNDNLFISDRRPLHEVIVFSDTLRVRTAVGTLTGQVSTEAKNAFSIAISKAKTVRSASSTIERQVTEAVEKLKLELEIFQKTIKK